MAMNVTQLYPPPETQVQRVSVQAEETTPDFLTFKRVNKHVKLKISPRVLDLTPIPNIAHLFTLANSRGWFASVIQNTDGSFALILSPISDLRSQLLDGNTELFQPQRTVNFGGVVPHYVTFSCNETRLVVSLVQGPVLVYDACVLCMPGSTDVPPLHSFPSTTATSARQICPNPGDIPELVAILRDSDGKAESQLVEVINVMSMQSVAGWRSGATPDAIPASLSWSPKGKQLAIGLLSGDIICFNPSESGLAKLFVPRPPAAHDKGTVHTIWLANPTFYSILSPNPTDPQAEQVHMVITYDSKRSAATDIALPLSLFPTGTRPPGAFSLVLRGWDPLKLLLVVSDSTTSDMGVLGCSGTATEEKWQRFTLDDSVNPSLPLDEEGSEPTPLGLVLDLKNNQSYTHSTASGESVEIPPPPIMWAYSSEGTVTGWYIVNANGNPYPGMMEASAAMAVPQPQQQPMPPSASPFGQATTSPFGEPSGFGAPTTSPFAQAGPAFGQSAFGKPSAFGQAAGPGFGQPAFGQSGFGQPSTSPFGQPQPAAAQAPSTGGGFAAFAPTAPTKVGQNGFGAAPGDGTPMSATPISPVGPPPIQRTESVEMNADSSPAFGGLSLGGEPSPSQPKAGQGMGIFGAAASQPAPQAGTQPSSPFGNGGAFKLNSGFGLYANQVQNNVLPAQQSTPEPPKLSSGFGQTGFASTAASPAFGQSGFGQPAFGKSGFGASPMSATPTPTATAAPITTTPSASGSGGAFGSYASSGFSSFAAAAKEKAPEPAWKSSGDGKPVDLQPKSVFRAPSPPAAAPLRPSPPASPPTPTIQPAASPTPTPPSLEEPTPPSTPPSLAAPSTTPTPTPGGAFANLRSVESPFRSSTLSPGFGAFSNFNAETSPFAKAAAAAVKPTTSSSVFSQPTAFGAPSTPPKPSVFGQPTPLGAPKSVFGQTGFGAQAPSTPPALTTTPQTTTTPTTSPAASAFGAGSAFGKYAGAGTGSFASLLRTAPDETEGEKKAPVSAFAKAAPSPPKPAAEPPKSVFAAYKAEEKTAAEKAKEKEEEEEKEKAAPSKPIPAEGEQEVVEKSVESVLSSFVEVRHGEEEEEEEEEEERGPPSPTSSTEEGEGVVDDVSDFLSEGFSDREEEEAQPEYEEEIEEGQLEPAEIPLPPSEAPSRPLSPSATPPSRPSISVQPETPEKAKAKAKEEESTTPPGSPVRTPSPQPPLAQPSPSPLLSPSPSPILGVGLGRPSTRPLRSSPLANNAPVSGEEEEAGAQSAAQAAASQGLKPHPAPPKTPFGQWRSPTTSPLEAKPPSPFGQLPAPVFTKPEPATPSEAKVSRPKTPPLQAVFGKPSPALPTPPSAPSPAAMPPPTIFPPSHVAPPSGLFGGLVPPAAPPMGQKLGMPPPAFPGLAAPPKPEPPKPVQPTLEEGMQKECMNLFSVLGKELEDLRLMAEKASKQRETMSQSGHAHGPELTLDEIARFGKTLKTSAKNIEEVEALTEKQKASIREFESDMLKAKTRKEEIVRFDKAKSDADFAKMLKTRSLSPENIELQNQLRKDMRAMRSTIEKLEGNLQESKRKLNEIKTGKPRIKAPSLDTVNRTYRNIEIAIDQQAADISTLAARMSKLDLEAPSLNESQSRDRRLPDRDAVFRRSVDVTPHVASTTAAALNAERSARKLKNALLSIRKEPLLNTKAAKATSTAPTVFDTPGKHTDSPFGRSAMSISAFGPPPSTPNSSSPFNIPSVDVDNSPTPQWGTRHRATSRHHGKPVPLKTPPSSAPKAGSTFDWGPLPTTKPLSMLPVDLRSFKPSTP